MGQNIHLIFKTHLDVGFTDHAAAVVQNYFSQYIPNALATASEIRRMEQPEKFIWTTGSWLIYTFLDQAAPTQRKEMENAILAGDITWHALPFTTHTELMDVELFRYGLSLSQELDRRFGKHTIAAKFTDVPGHTRGIVPLMAEAGITFLHIGINPGSSIPCVPPLFRWQDPSGKELIVMVESGYGNLFTIEGLEDSLAFAHTIDNLGPQSSEQVLDVYHSMQKSFPNAHIFASSLNDFANKLEPIRQQLPIITEEIGDTWIHGIGSDPLKVSQFRELLRLRVEWLAKDPGIRHKKWFENFEQRLLLVPEHTWGMDKKTFLHDHENYTAAAFHKARSKPNFKKFESSWAEKRTYIQAAVNELDDPSFTVSAENRLDAIHPAQPHFSSWHQVADVKQPIELEHWTVQFDPSTGALISLTTHHKSKMWADSSHMLGTLRYQTFSSQDYERFFHQYILPAEQKNSWSREDFTKPGMESADAPSRFWQPRIKDQYTQNTNRESQFLFHLIAEPPSDQEYGCPKDFYLQYTFHQDRSDVDIDLQWFNKYACRLPEALWVTFQPCSSKNAEWQIEKLGEYISPLHVVKKGNRHLHASGKDVICKDGMDELKITALDSPLVAPGKPALLNFSNEQPDMSGGVHFNLYNNVWGTNFPMWFEEDCRFRFVLRFL